MRLGEQRDLTAEEGPGRTFSLPSASVSQTGAVNRYEGRSGGREQEQARNRSKQRNCNRNSVVLPPSSCEDERAGQVENV